MANVRPIPLAVPHISDLEIEAAVAVLRSGHLTQGTEVAAFETEFSETVADYHCVAVSSGTSALHLVLLAAGIGRGDEVIVPSFTFGATAHVVALTGATPVFVDIIPDTFCIDPEAVAAAVTAHTTAVVPVHLYGHPAQMDRLTEVGDRHGLAVVEDAAQATGAVLHQKPAGTWGTAGCFSFHASKNMHTIEGGMITTPDPDLARRLRVLRNQGFDRPYHYVAVGLNARMTDLAAAIGRAQLTMLDRWTATRRANAAYLTANLDTVATPVTDTGASHAYHQFTVRSPERDNLRERLANVGISSAVYYPIPVHRTAAYMQDLTLPHTDLATAEVLSLPIHPALTSTDLARIADEVNR